MNDWCKYFQDIEDDPFAVTPRLTIRQFNEAREHAENCRSCYDRIERVVEKYSDVPERPSSN